MQLERSTLAAALATLAIAAAIPIPLAQLDFAGAIDVFAIDAGDTPALLRTLAGIGGVLTIAVLAIALAGVLLALGGSHRARDLLIAAAVGGLLTAPPLWVPTGAVLGAAAALLGSTSRSAPA